MIVGATRRRFLRAQVVAALAAALGGCYSYAPFTIALRDRGTHEPVADATVRVENTGINPAKPPSVEAVTDERGEARIEAAMYNRLLIRIEAPGRAAQVLNGDHPAQWGDSGWYGPNVDEDGGRASIEVRLKP